MLMGYARASKNDGQSTATQIAALKAAGSTKIFLALIRSQWARLADDVGDVFIIGLMQNQDYRCS
jgi:hypothetical protein